MSFAYWTSRDLKVGHMTDQDEIREILLGIPHGKLNSGQSRSDKCVHPLVAGPQYSTRACCGGSHNRPHRKMGDGLC
jgi:hypothetical protein